MTGSALAVAGVTVELAGRTVVEDVDLRVDFGELVALIGPNGAGKTTLLRTVLGLQRPAAGDVRLGTADVGYVPQRHEFAWDFPIDVQRVVLTGRVRGIGFLRAARPSDFAAVGTALERVGLTALARRPIAELSGGQRQRALVARALASDPRLLLLDEPFTGLDRPTQTALTELFSALRDEGRAVVMTTHDIAAAAALADRLCLLNRAVIADGPASDLTDAAVWLQAFGADGVASLVEPLATPS